MTPEFVIDAARRYAEQMGDEAKALEFAKIAITRAPNDDTARARQASLLAASTDPAQRADARKILWELVDKDGPFKRAALLALGRAPELTAEEQTRILAALGSNPSPTPDELFLAADIQLRLRPDDANRAYDEIIARLGTGGDVATRIQLALWLNAHQQFERVLSLLPVDQAAVNNQLLLPHLDALASLQRWDDIAPIINLVGLSV